MNKQYMPFRPGILAAAISLALCIPTFWHQEVRAEQGSAEIQTFDLPAAPLAETLNAIAARSDRLISVAPSLTRGLQAPAVRGDLTAEQAVRQALAGSGLVLRVTASGVLTLERAPAADVQALEEITISGAESRNALSALYAGGQVGTGGRLGLLGNRSDMDTPFSATQYTTELIENQMAQSIGDVLVNDPSVRNTYARGSGRDEFNIRGFTLYNYDVSYNGLYGVSPRNASTLIGVERVEVLRGPNALLNGMAPYGSIGGAINLIPKRAGAKPLNRVTFSYMGDSQFGSHLDIGHRYGDSQQWGVRVNGLYRAGQTPVRDVKEDLGALSLGLDYRGDRLRVEADFNYQNRLTHARSGLLFPPSAGVSVGAVPKADENFFPDWTFWKAKEHAGVVRAEFDVSQDWAVYGAVGGMDYDFSSLQTSWLMLDDQGNMGARPTRLNERVKTLTGEIGVRGRFHTGSVGHEAVVSASFFDLDHQQLRIQSPIVLSNLYEPVDLAKPDIAISRHLPKIGETRLSSFAVADTLSFADGGVQVTAGMRNQQVESRTFNPVNGERTARYNKSAVTPAFALLVRPTLDLSLYGNYIEGLSQGPTAPATALNAGEVFPPSRSKQIEIGAKYDFGSTTVTVSAFQIERPSSFLDAQTLRFTEDGQQRNRGVELLLAGEPVNGIRWLGGAAYTRAILARTAQGLHDGNVAPAVPRYQANMGIEWDLSAVPGLTLNARMVYTSTQYVDVANTQKLPAWTRFDLGARYALSVGKTPVTVRASVENVFNRNYWQSAAREGLTIGAPRTVLLSVAAEF